MTSLAQSAEQLCRITVVGPTRRVDVALPVALPVAELFPSIARHAELDLRREPDWVLQRVGDKPLDLDNTLAAQSVLDGEVLYLRPRPQAAAPAEYDDVVDGVAEAVSKLPNRWQATMTRTLFLVAVAAALLIAAAGSLVSGPTVVEFAAAAAGVVLLTVAATVASRAAGDAQAAAMLGAGAVVVAVPCGLMFPRLLGMGGFPSGVGVLWAGVLAAVICVLVMTGVAVRVVHFGCALVVFVAVAAGGAAVVLGLTPARAAALVASVMFVFSVFAPINSARVVGLRLPTMPTDADALRAESSGIGSEELFARARRADKIFSAVFIATAVVTAGASGILAFADDWRVRLLLGVLAAASLVRSRIEGSVQQRFSAALAGVTACAALLIWVVWSAGPVGRAAVVVGVLVLAILLTVGSRLLVDKQLLPYWGRAADIAETLLAVAIVPILLWVLGAYSFARTLFG
ncbi:type VII secretion integral membrane protein EccD [Micromonospora sp. NBC_01412]|uniref:type VII secretion integral membrane protein EccD n=1 Tax=Micromonospora sp. NBC_01412 TaxID=2903590 RepID=UPI003252E984